MVELLFLGLLELFFPNKNKGTSLDGSFFILGDDVNRECHEHKETPPVEYDYYDDDDLPW